MTVLQLSVHFPPNIGGVETHLWDLVTLLANLNLKVFILCYRPLSTKTTWKVFEKKKNLQILRIPWVAGFFYKLISYPLLEFIYLFPGIFMVTPFVLFIKKPSIIHAHGLISGIVAIFWGKIFQKRIIISTHSIYSFPDSGFYHQLVKFIFSRADNVLCLSERSYQEILRLGVYKNKLIKFTYWIDLEKFKKVPSAKKKFLLKEKFIVLFVGRLINEKGLGVLLKSVNLWNRNIGLIIVGNGPLEKKVKQTSCSNPHVHFLNKLDQDELAVVYSAADVLIFPSISEEGFGRVIIESLACGTPVIVSAEGSIPEVVNDTVGEFIKVTPQNIKRHVENLYNNPVKLRILSSYTRKFAQNRYSKKNAQVIVQAYAR